MDIIENFLPNGEFREVQRKTNLNRGRFYVRSVRHLDCVIPVLDEARKRIKQVNDYKVQQVLLRFEGETGALHHDLNKAPHRKLSMIYYMDEPTVGGEIIFPFFDSDAKPTSNLATEKCNKLFEKNKFSCKDKEVKKYITEHKEKILTISPKSNMAIVFPSDDRNTWHFVTSVEEGRRSCLVVFYMQE